jgi:hypothetical protein
MSIERRNYGRNHGYKIDGTKVPGVTTITRLMPKDKLVPWAGRVTAEHAIDHWAELAALPPSKRLEVLTWAWRADRDAAANRGTQVHRLARQLADGQEVDVPPELAGHVESYRDFLDRLGVRQVATELVVAKRKPRAARYCGTLDLIADLPELVTTSDEVLPAARWLLDLKTSRKGPFREVAVQLCGYRHADVFIAEDGSERPMPWLEVERTGVVWVRADGWDLYPVDTGPEVLDYWRRLVWLYYREDASQQWVGEAVVPPLQLADEPREVIGAAS